MRLETLGVLNLKREKGEAPVLGSGKPLAVLAYLSASPNRTAARNTLISLLWADLEADAAKHALRQTIWYLRQKSGTELITAAGDSLRLTAAVEVDRDELLEASAGTRHDEVIALYTGPFIPGFAAPGGAGFEEWCALERRRLLEVFRHSAEAAVGASLTRGHARLALDLARRLRDQDVYNENGWRLLIEACISAGDLLGAKAEAEALQQLSEREEMDLEPGTRGLIRTARSQTAGVSSSGTGAVPALSASLVGREEAFASLLQAWEQARAGRVSRVHIAARSGIGKTRLLRDFGARLKGMRAKVVSVSGTTGMRDIAFGVASDLAAGLAMLPGKRSIAPESAATLVALNPSLSTYFEVAPRNVGLHEVMRARTIALRELLTAVAFEHPVAILVDDLHWWDEASAAMLAAVIDGARDVRLLLVTTARIEGDRLSLAAQEGTRQITLDPLTADQVDELVLSIAALPNEAWARDFSTELWRASRGTPLLALEMLKLLEDRGLLARRGGLWATDRPEALSDELRAGNVLRARLESMERNDLWLLTLVCAAGATLEPAVIALAADRPEVETIQRLTTLESRGLVVQEGGAWRISHDEISEELRRLTTHDGMAAASVKVGRALHEGAPLTDARARRAANLLRVGNDLRARVELFRSFARWRFSVGDRRRLVELAADLFGPETRQSEIHELRTAMPWSWRLGLVSPARRATAATLALSVLVVGALAILTRPAAPAPEAVLGLAFVDSTGRVSFESVDLRETGWTPLEMLETTPWRSPATIQLGSANGFNLDYMPRTRQFVTAQAVDDDGVIDLFLYDGGRAPRRLAPHARDDGGPAFSPDGKYIAYSTARWDTLSHYDIAVLAIGDTVPIQLTSGPASDGGVTWSPGGARIAFERSNWGNGPNEVCVVTIDTRALECEPASAPGEQVSPVAWMDRERLVLIETSGASSIVKTMHWPTRQSSPVYQGFLNSYSFSRDGRWLFCTCSATVRGDLVPSVIPLSAPNLIRPVDLHGRTPNIAFWIATGASVEAAGLHIERPRLAARVPTELRASVVDRANRVIQYPTRVRWSVRDPSSASVDSLSGVIIPGDRDSVTIYAAAGIAHDSVVVAVSRDSARVLLDETWASMDRWIPYGFPAPSIESGADGRRTFLNNGDGSFESGVVSRSAFDPARGIAVDVEASTPVTSFQWQLMRTGLNALRDTLSYVKSAGRNAHPRLEPTAEVCAFGFPAEGRLVGPHPTFVIAALARATSAAAPPSLLSGAWNTLRLQLFPDGRCGVAVNGVPIGTVPGLAASEPVRVIVGGNSYHTRIAVGRVRVYSGVPLDIDWSKARRY